MSNVQTISGDLAVTEKVRIYSDDGNPLGAIVETVLALPTLNTAFLDSQVAQINLPKRVVYLLVTTPLTWVTSGQPTWQPITGRTAAAAAGGAASQVDAQHALAGTAQNLGASGTTLAAGLYRLSPSGAAELQWPDPFLGIELKFPSALTAGAAQLYVEAAA